MNFQLEYADELNELIENENDVGFLRKIVLECNDPDTIKEAIDGLLEFSIQNNLCNAKAWAYYYLGWYHFDKAQYNKAAECFLWSNDVFEITNNKTGLIYACNGLTNLYCQIGQFNLANEWGLKGISLCEEVGNNEALVILLINTGINYIQMEYYHKGKEIFQSLEFIDYELTETQQVSCYLAMAEIEINIGDAAKAISYIETAYLLEKELKITKSYCEIFRLKGMAYAKLCFYDKAEESFKKSYDFSVENDLIYEKCCTMIQWSKLNIFVGRISDAIKLLDEVVEISSSKKLNVLLLEAYNLLYTIYKELNIPDKALKYLENYMAIDEEIYNYEQNQLVAKMNLDHAKREANKYKSLYAKTELLSYIGQKIISKLDLKSIIEIIDEEISKLLEADYFSIAVYDDEKKEVAYYSIGKEKEFKEDMHLYGEDTSFALYCIKNKEDIIIGNVNKEYKKYIKITSEEFQKKKLEGNMKSMIFTPLIINDKVVGIVTVQSIKENAYDHNDLNTVKILANYSAIAIQNAISYKKVEDLAIYDNLTRFLTKFEIIKLGEIIFDKYKVGNSTFSVTMIDIDHFKKVNDTYGHVVGDEVLKMVSETISSCIRNGDYIGRYGGDEFLLICPNLGGGCAVDVAERIRVAVSEKIYNLGEDINIKVTLSLGVHEYNKNDKSFLDMVNEADKNLYIAKERNRNLVIYS